MAGVQKSRTERGAERWTSPWEQISHLLPLKPPKNLILRTQQPRALFLLLIQILGLLFGAAPFAEVNFVVPYNFPRERRERA